MSRVVSNATLAAGMRTEFTDTYERATDRVLASETSWIMDMSIQTQTRVTPFSFYESPPHMEYWARGSAIPQDAFGSLGWETPIHEWGIRVPFSKFDRKDDQTDSLLERAADAGASAARLPQRFAMDLLQATANTLPGIPTAPDGVGMFSATDAAGLARFGVTGGNIVTGNGVASISAILTDYYACIARWRNMLDRPYRGQPRFNPSIIDAGVYIIHPAAHERVFEEAFRQMRQGIVLGTDAGTTPSNIIMDVGRRVELWSTSELTVDSNDWFIGLIEAPKKPLYLVDREGVREFSAIEDDNNSDHVRKYGEEYIQWERRAGAGIALPDGILKVSNS